MKSAFSAAPRGRGARAVSPKAQLACCKGDISRSPLSGGLSRGEAGLLIWGCLWPGGGTGFQQRAPEQRRSLGQAPCLLLLSWPRAAWGLLAALLLLYVIGTAVSCVEELLLLGKIRDVFARKYECFRKCNPGSSSRLETGRSCLQMCAKHKLVLLPSQVEHNTYFNIFWSPSV